jgi:hypothetical protein
MSRNLSDFTRERQPITRLRHLTQQEAQVRTLQHQGSQAIRLAVVEGFLEVPITDPWAATPENARFVEIVAPEDATILVGSLVYSTYMVKSSPSLPTANVWPLDASNAGGGGVVWKVWLPHSLQTDDPDYETPYDWDQPFANGLPPNRIRIGAKLTLQQGSWSTDNFSLFVLYQLRMTIGWN